MQTHTYVPTGSFGTTTTEGESIEFEWWAGPALGPLPDERAPRFPRRLDWDGRDDGGWLALGEVSAYGPCGCCNTRPCLPQCPVQTCAPRDSGFWPRRWWMTAQEMTARGQAVAPRYQTAQSVDDVMESAPQGGGADGGQAG